MKDSRAKGATQRVRQIIRALKKVTRGMPKPAADLITEKYGRNPYLTLIACILSVRTRDTTSYPAAVRLFGKAKTPKSMLKLPVSQIKKLIYPVGFYKTKAKNIQLINKKLLDEYGGKVPKSQQELMKFPGVGLKTANLVLSEGFNMPALVVDTHLHRLCNKGHFGLVNTKTPEETEKALQKIVPKKDWNLFTNLVLKWGQNGCKSGTRKCVCDQLGI